MRTVTTILMLCLPMAAMGETYVCEPEKVSSVFDKDLTVSDFQSLVIEKVAHNTTRDRRTKPLPPI